jgi:hypothetical protein
VFTRADGTVVNGTRPYAPDFGSITAQRTIGRSLYNAFEADLRYHGAHGSVRSPVVTVEVDGHAAQQTREDADVLLGVAPRMVIGKAEHAPDQRLVRGPDPEREARASHGVDHRGRAVRLEQRVTGVGLHHRSPEFDPHGDPIPTADYYALGGIFQSTRIVGDFSEYWRDGRVRLLRPQAMPSACVRLPSSAIRSYNTSVVTGQPHHLTPEWRTALPFESTSTLPPHHPRRRGSRRLNLGSTHDHRNRAENLRRDVQTSKTAAILDCMRPTLEGATATTSRCSAAPITTTASTNTERRTLPGRSTPHGRTRHTPPRRIHICTTSRHTPARSTATRLTPRATCSSHFSPTTARPPR